MMCARAGAVALGLSLAACGAETGSVAALDGWAGADHARALDAYRNQCAALDRPCPSDTGDARTFWEEAFVPMVADGADAALVTGYYEPVLAASVRRTEHFSVPLHAMPDEADALSATRAEIEAGALEPGGEVLYWLADPVDAFFLHVQGSGRLSLRDGREVRVGYAGRNLHPYRSIGRIAARRGLLPAEGMTADRLKRWLRTDPDRGRALMAENPAYIFFRTVESLEPDEGPIGALGLPLTPGVSVALDPAHYPPGSVVWIEADGAAGPIRRLMLAQDAGSAIKGPARADMFFGTGAEAGRRAGDTVARGRIVLLSPGGET